MWVICLFCSLRDSSNESGATDAVGLSMSMSEMEDPEVKGKKKRGRPGKQAPVGAHVCRRVSDFPAFYHWVDA